MPYCFGIHAEHDLAVIGYKDPVAVEDIRSVFDALVHHGMDYPGLNAIADFSRCRLAFTSADLRELSRYSEVAATTTGPAKWVIVANDDLSFGLGRMFAAFAAGLPVETGTFRSPVVAQEWLGMEIDLAAMLAEHMA